MNLLRCSAASLILLMANIICYGAGKSGSSLPKTSEIIDGFNCETAMTKICDAAPGTLCGLWQSVGNGSIIAIVPDNRIGSLRSATAGMLMVVLQSPSPEIQPGTIMGYVAPTAKPDYWSAYIYTRCRYSEPAELSGAREFLLRLNDQAKLSMVSVKDGLEIVPWKIIPYMFRAFLREKHTRPSDLDGFVKIYPEPIPGVTPKSL